MQKIHPLALFRLSVLGPLASRSTFKRGELKQLLTELAARPYDIPGSRKTHISEKTLQAWYYAWREGGIEALEPKARCDKGQSKISAELQAAILEAKRENPQRSLRQIKQLMEQTGLAARGQLSRSSIHRLLQRHGLSHPAPGEGAPVERRSFVAERAGDIWYSDVLHGPKVRIKGRWQKSYLISLMDDASRLIAHSAFCASETALAVEGVLKQALLKRGLPVKLIVDNGAAYRADSLQGICARLQIRLIYCRPFQPQGKGKLERWHRVIRSRFLSELTETHCQNLAELNARLWAWLEQIYHQSAHSGLDGLTPWARWQQDLVHIRPLGPLAEQLDALFYHRHRRTVRKDGTVSFQGQRFEVDYQLSSCQVVVVVDPHREQVIGVENTDGERLGLATPLDATANLHRPRVRGHADAPAASAPDARRFNAVEQAYQTYAATLTRPSAVDEEDEG